MVRTGKRKGIGKLTGSGPLLQRVRHHHCPFGSASRPRPHLPPLPAAAHVTLNYRRSPNQPLIHDRPLLSSHHDHQLTIAQRSRNRAPHSPHRAHLTHHTPNDRKQTPPSLQPALLHATLILAAADQQAADPKADSNCTSTLHSPQTQQYLEAPSHRLRYQPNTRHSHHSTTNTTTTMTTINTSTSS